MPKERTQFDSSERRYSPIAGSSSRSRGSSAANFSGRPFCPSQNGSSTRNHSFPRNFSGQQDRPTSSSHGNRRSLASNSFLQQYPPYGSTLSTSNSQRYQHPTNTLSRGRYTPRDSSSQQFLPSSSAPNRNYNFPPVAEYYHPSINTSRSFRSFHRYRSRNNSFFHNSSGRYGPERDSFRSSHPFPQSKHATPVPTAKHTNESSTVTSAEPPPADRMKEWDEVRCPVCMEHPHNAVLLICSSHYMGCRPFICDTSYRHSNCFDQFGKGIRGNNPFSKLTCPLCRGEVQKMKVIESARKYMNSKVRNCSKETCGFSGAYDELRRHARREHPDSRPSEVDPERQRDWRRMEEQQGFNDLLSTMRSSIDDEEIGFVANFFFELRRSGRGLSPFEEDDLLSEPELEPENEMTFETFEDWWQDQGAWQSQLFSDDEWSDLDLGLDLDLSL